MTPAVREAGPLARVLLDQAVRTFRLVPGPARDPGLQAIDRFLEDPQPSRFLAAVRQLEELRRRRLIESNAAITLRRGRAEALAALRAVPGFPAAITDRLEQGLPLEPRGAQRLLALAAMARAYEALAGQVAADTDQMHQRLRVQVRRSRAARPKG